MRRAFGPCPARGPPASTLGPRPAEALFDLVAKPGLRWGTAFATAMLVFALLRELFGGESVDPASMGGSGYFVPGSTLSLIPTSVTPAWWQTMAVVALVAAAGVVTGALASRHLIASPLGVSRRVRRPAPRPWGLLLVGAGLGALAAAVSGAFGRNQAVTMAGILLVVLGSVALAPWVAFRSGQRSARRTSDPATLIAAGHLVSDPRPAGWAAAAVGAIGIVSGAAAVFETSIFFGNIGRDGDPFFVTSYALVGVALILVLLVTASTLAVHAAESLVDRRRVLAGLVAAGTPLSVLRDALRREAMLTSMPLSFGGVLIGAVVAGAANPIVNLAGLLLACAQVTVKVGLTWAAIRIAIRAVARRLLRPRHRRTCAPSSRDDPPTCPRSQPEALAGNDPAPHRCPPCRTPRKNSRRCCRAARSWRPPSRTHVSHHLGELFAGARPRSNGTSAATASCHRQGRARRGKSERSVAGNLFLGCVRRTLLVR